MHAPAQATPDGWRALQGMPGRGAHARPAPGAQHTPTEVLRQLAHKTLPLATSDLRGGTYTSLGPLNFIYSFL